MNNINDDDLSHLTEKLFRLNNKLDRSLQNVQKIINKIEQKYDLRTEFNRWRNSNEGKLWKEQKYYQQKQCCAICQEKIQLKWSHIDHIKPISLYPALSLKTSNMQITCGPCNTSKKDRSPNKFVINEPCITNTSERLANQ